MAQTSVGFDGTIADVQWSNNAGLLTTGGPVLKSSGDLAVTGTTSGLTVAAGTIGAWGVATTLSAAESLALPNSVASGGQWFLVTLHRIWGTKLTQLKCLAGATTTTTPPVALPSSYPAAFATGHGVEDDAPVAWIWAVAGSTALQIARLAFAIGDNRGTTAQRDAKYGAYSTQVAALGIDGRPFYNTDTGREERHVATPPVNGFTPAVPGVWVPTRGGMRGRVTRSSTLALPDTSTRTAAPFDGLDTSFNTGPLALAGGGIRVPKAGVWQMVLRGQSNGSAATSRLFEVSINGTVQRIIETKGVSNATGIYFSILENLLLTAGDYVTIGISSVGNNATIATGMELALYQFSD